MGARDRANQFGMQKDHSAALGAALTSALIYRNAIAPHAMKMVSCFLHLRAPAVPVAVAHTLQECVGLTIQGVPESHASAWIMENVVRNWYITSRESRFFIRILSPTATSRARDERGGRGGGRPVVRGRKRDSEFIDRKQREETRKPRADAELYGF